MSDTVQVDDPAPGLRLITLNRPDRRNAVDWPTAQALAAAFKAFDGDPSAKVCVLTGAGGHFCAGADLKAVGAEVMGESGRINPDIANSLGPMGPTRMLMSKPVVAAIEGYAVAGGLELACWADLRVASVDARLGVFCRRFGVPLIDGGTVRLPRLIGHSRAMDLILTGREVGAQEAFDIGLVNRLAPAGQALSASLQLAQELAALPQQCLRGDRLSAIQQWGLSKTDALANEMRHGLATLASGETVQGAQRFTAGLGRGGEPLT
jgi:enoyl-CoA hydratase